MVASAYAWRKGALSGAELMSGSISRQFPPFVIFAVPVVDLSQVLLKVHLPSRLI